MIEQGLIKPDQFDENEHLNPDGTEKKQKTMVVRNKKKKDKKKEEAAEISTATAD